MYKRKTIKILFLTQTKEIQNENINNDLFKHRSDE